MKFTKSGGHNLKLVSTAVPQVHVWSLDSMPLDLAWGLKAMEWHRVSSKTKNIVNNY